MINYLKDIISKEEFQTYLKKIHGIREDYTLPYRSWIGVNFDSSLATFKFYFTFFEKVKGETVEALLKNNYSRYLDKLSEIDEQIAFDFYAPGSGITFTWKWNAKKNDSSEGFFFRIIKDKGTASFSAFLNELGIERTAEENLRTSPGYYFMDNGKQISEKFYYYTSSAEIIKKLSDNWATASLAECIEIGLGNTLLEEAGAVETKFILLGNYENTIAKFLSEINNNHISELCEWMKSKKCFPLCPGKYINDDTYSIYFFSKQEMNPQPSINTIELLLENFQSKF